MRRLPSLAALSLAACNGAAGNGTEPVRADPAPPRGEAVAAGQGQEAAVRARLAAILRAGPGDPAGDARQAAAAGNFRLIWAVWMGGRGVIGPACRFPPYAPPDHRTPLLPMSRIHSDVAGSCESFNSRMPNACQLDARLDAYAAVYNRTIVADPHFPYPDLCDGGRPPPGAQRARDSYDRPLAVLAVTGRYDPHDLRLRDELPPGWIARLGQAGMDVNATWLGSTALDWADALGMGDSATARQLVRLGGRRLKRADLSGGNRF